MAVSEGAPKAKREAYEKAGARVIPVKKKGPGLDLKDLLRRLCGMGINDILVEGGGTLIAGLVESRLVDRFIFFIAPKIIGGRSAVTPVEGSGVDKIGDAMEFESIRIRRFGGDIMIEAGVV
jgi:diaminohydroxyphosphoribosylaminopyrimidine deaminase/5-amino-6-(5-phosphoribosylamino)uracil reductase